MTGNEQGSNEQNPPKTKMQYLSIGIVTGALGVLVMKRAVKFGISDPFSVLYGLMFITSIIWIVMFRSRENQPGNRTQTHGGQEQS